MTAGSHRAETGSLVIGIIVVLLVASIGLTSAGVAADTTDDAAKTIDDAPTYELEIDNDGSAAAIGFPGPVNGTVDDLFVEGTDGVSAVYRYSAADEGWNNVLEEDGVDDFSDVSVDPMDSLVVLTTGQGDSEAIPLEVTLETETGDTVTPGQRDVEAGWNFVSSPQHTDADTVFGAGTADTSLVLERYDGPRTVAVEQTPEFGEYYLGSGHPPTTDPFSGYFVFAQDNGTVPTVASGITDRDDADAQLDLPTFDDVTVRGDITSGAEDGSLTDGDITVRLDGEEIDIDDGEYEETLAPGEYTVTVEADGHQTATRDLDARFATAYEEDVELEGAVVNRDGEKSYVSAAKAAEDAGDGATISLESGTYEDDLEITADGVTIEGTSGVSLVSTASKTGETTVVGDINITADGVTVRDLSVHDGTVSVSNSDDLTLSTLDITGETGTADPGANSAGIEVDGGENLSITNVAIEADRGISVSGVRTADLHGIDVTTDDGMGLVLYDATGVDLDGVAVDGANEAVGLINVADSTVGNVAIEDSTLGLAVGNESGSQTTPGNLTLTGDLELNAIVPYAEMTEGTADPVEIDRPDGLTHAIRTEPVSGVPVSVTGFTYDETSAIAGAVALTNGDGANGQPLAEASAVQRLSDDAYVVAPETSPQDAADIASEGATIEVREGTYDGEMSIQTDGVTVSGENATFEEKLEVDDANDVTLDGLSATNHTIGIEVASSTGVILTDVNASGNEYEGLLVESSEDVEIVNATASDNYNGLINVGDGTSVTASNSTFTENEGWGVGTDGDGSLTVRNSTINGNGDGAAIWNDGTLDAAENWWGAPSGPSGEADGTGDSVGSDVDYEPWLDAQPGEDPDGLEDAGVELSNFETDATAAADRGDTVTTSVDVTNAVESVGFSTMAIDDGAELEVEYVLVDGEDEEEIASETVTVVAGETETVEFAESLPGSTTAHEERSVEHEIRIAGEGVGERADLELANPVQTALEFAESAGANTVDVEPGTYDETVDVSVDGLTVTGPADGIATITNGSTPVTVSGTDTTVEGLAIESTDLYSAVEIAGPATDVTVADNAIDGGIDMAADGENLEGVTIEGNEIEAPENMGVRASVSGDDAVIDGLEIVDNVFDEYHQNAIEVYSASGGEFTASVEITGNEIVAEDIFESDGIYVHATIERVSIENNEIRHAQSSAINVQRSADDIEVRQNTIADNGAGIKLYGSGTLDATENWWGDVSGPSGIGDGSGDAIEVDGDGSVDYAPWLDGPIPDGDPVVGSAGGSVTASGDTSETDTDVNGITTMQTPGTDDPVTDATMTIYPLDPDATGDGLHEPTEVDVEDDGSYSVEDLPVGDHGFVAEADGFLSETQTVSVARGETTNADFDLEYADGGTIEGEIALDEVDPEENVSVTVAVDGTNDETTAELDGETDTVTYAIEDVDVNVDDGYTVTATTDSEHYNTDETSGIQVDVGQPTENVDLSLERDTGTAAGTVIASGDTSETDADTNAITTMQTPGTDDPVADATVTVYPFDPDASSDETLEPIEVDSNGEYSIENLPVGTHGIVADADGFAAATQAVTIEQGVTTDDADFDLEYADGGTVSGTVSLDEVDPAEDVTVTVAPEETDDETTTFLAAETDSAAFIIDDVAVDVDDGYTVTATADSANYGDAVQDAVTVDVGETADIGELTLERDTGGAEGTVTASGDTASSGGASTSSVSTTSTPIAGENVDDATVTVHYFDADANGDGDVTVDVTDGSFSVDQLPVGTHGFAIEGDGLESDTRTETIEDGSTTENVDFNLDYAEGGALSGSVSIPEPADGDFPVDVTVLDGEDEVASEEVTIADGDSSTAYTFENVDVNVDDGYTVSVTTDAFESAPKQENVIVDVGDETTDIDIDLTDPVAQRVDVDASDTSTTVGEWVEFTATVTNDAGTPVEGVTVEATDDGEDVDYRNGESSQTTNEGGETSFEATTETEQQVDSIQFTFTEQDNDNEGIEYGVKFEADEIHTFSVEDDTLDGAPYASIAVNAKDQYGNDVNFNVEVDVSDFDSLTEPCSDSDTCTETSTPIRFETENLQDSGTAEFTETNSGMTDSLEISIDRV